jgi:hypothetical protein
VSRMSFESGASDTEMTSVTARLNLLCQKLIKVATFVTFKLFSFYVVKC